MSWFRRKGFDHAFIVVSLRSFCDVRDIAVYDALRRGVWVYQAGTVYPCTICLCLSCRSLR